nr:phospholipid carrier-dependent glycosyltransferase [Vallicoccus soli]
MPSTSLEPPAAPTAPAAPDARPARPARVRRGARDRLLTPLPAERPWSWLGPLLVAAVAGGIRSWRLGTPGELVFDEVYYADQARDLLRHGTEVTDAGAPEFVVHPPLGKWLIGLGEQVLGYDPVGWRVVVALLGTLSVLVLARAGRRLLRSTLLGCTAGLLLAVDGLHVVHSRTALLDVILGTFVLCAFACLLVDRDRVRERLAAALPLDAARYGPPLGLRPWRLAAGVLLGAACATKWSGLFFLAAFGLLTVLWDVGARRAAGVRRPWGGALLRDAAPAAASLVLTSAVLYVTSWAGWFAAGPDRAYGRDWAAGQPGSWLPASVRSWLHLQAQMLQVNQDLSTPHPYESNPWGWLVLARPVSFYYETPEPGTPGCGDADSCSQAVTGLGTPALWWAAVAALAVLLVLWAGARDWRAGAVLCGVAAGWLPWFAYQDRTIYSFYAVAFVPFLVLAVVLVLGMVVGPPGAPPRRRRWGLALAGAYVLLVVVDFAWLYPVLTAEVVPYGSWYDRMWLRSWI